MDTKNFAGKTGLTAAWEETFSKIKSLFDNLTLPWSKITSAPTTVSGYGITDVYTKTEVDSAINAEAAARQVAFICARRDSLMTSLNLTSRTDIYTRFLNNEKGAKLWRLQ